MDFDILIKAIIFLVICPAFVIWGIIFLVNRRKGHNISGNDSPKTHGGNILHGKNVLSITIVALFLVSVLYLVISFNHDNSTINNTVSKTETTQINSSTDETLLIDEDNIDNNTTGGDYHNEELNGRGRSDIGRSEPDYINVIGYVVVSSSQTNDIEKSDNFTDSSLWVIPTYEQDKQFWNQTNTYISHKTEVVVRKQILKHEGYGRYSGYLLVEDINDYSQFYINVDNFITKPYWTYENDIIKAAMIGDYVAKFKQRSDYYPVNKDNEKVEIPDDTYVLVTGITGTYGKNGPDDSTNQVKAIVWKEWKISYGGVNCYFNVDDLEIVY